VTDVGGAKAQEAITGEGGTHFVVLLALQACCGENCIVQRREFACTINKLYVIYCVKYNRQSLPCLMLD